MLLNIGAKEQISYPIIYDSAMEFANWRIIDEIELSSQITDKYEHDSPVSSLVFSLSTEGLLSFTESF